MKRTLACLLALVLLLALSIPAMAEEKASFTYWVGLDTTALTNYDDRLGYQIAQEATGIDVEFLHPAKGTEPDAFKILIASGEYPDAIQYTWDKSYPAGVTAAMDDGVIIDLKPYLTEEYVPNMIKYFEKYPELWSYITTDDGRIGTIPCIYTNSTGASEHQKLFDRSLYSQSSGGLIVRQDWLEAQGIELPTTVDGWDAALRQLKEAYTLDATFTTTWSNLKGKFPFISAYDICVGLYNDEGIVKYGPAEDKMKDALTLLNKWYADGILDVDFAVNDSKAVTANVLNEKSALWIGTAGSNIGAYYQSMVKAGKTEFNAIPVTSPSLEEGGQPKFSEQALIAPFSGISLAITSTSTNIETVLKFVDYAFTEEGNMSLNWGKEGVSYEMVDGWPAFTDLVFHDPNGLTTADAQKLYLTQNGPWPVDNYNRVAVRVTYGTDSVMNTDNVWAASGKYSSNMPPVSLTSKEAEIYANYFNEINTYAEEMMQKFIMGSESLDGFEQFQKNLESMGLAEVLKVQQSALDRFLAR